MKLRGLVIILACIIIYCIPVTSILYLSNKETEKYVIDTEFDFSEASYGAAEPVMRMDVEEYYELDLNVTCITEEVTVLSKDAQVMLSESEEMFKGKAIAKLNGKDVVAKENGIVTRIEFNDNNQSVYYYSFDNMVFECMVPEKSIYLFQTDGNLYNDNNEKIKIIRKSNINEEGYYKVYMSIPKSEKYDYGKCIEGYKLYTGNVFKETLVVFKECVYKNDSGEYCVRIVDDEGNFIGETCVEIGYTDGTYICVTGVEEGQLCDSGYKSLSAKDGDEVYEVE